jgi:hypothetical protein
LQKRATLPPKEGAVPTLTHDAGKDEIEHSANDRNHHRAPSRGDRNDENYEYKPVFALAVGLMEIENLFRYPALAVGLMEIEN